MRVRVRLRRDASAHASIDCKMDAPGFSSVLNAQLEISSRFAYHVFRLCHSTIVLIVTLEQDHRSRQNHRIMEQVTIQIVIPRIEPSGSVS